MQRCDDNKTCTQWVEAIHRCLSRDIIQEFTGKQTVSPATSVKNYFSQQNLNIGINGHRSKYSKNHPTNHSWENLQVAQQQLNNNNTIAKNFNSNWILNRERFILELNFLNHNRAKLPIAFTTAKILKKSTDTDVIRTMKKINFIQSKRSNNDENQNNLTHSGNYSK